MTTSSRERLIIEGLFSLFYFLYTKVVLEICSPHNKAPQFSSSIAISHSIYKPPSFFANLVVYFKTACLFSLFNLYLTLIIIVPYLPFINKPFNACKDFPLSFDNDIRNDS